MCSYTIWKKVVCMLPWSAHLSLNIITIIFPFDCKMEWNLSTNTTFAFVIWCLGSRNYVNWKVPFNWISAVQARCAAHVNGSWACSDGNVWLISIVSLFTRGLESNTFIQGMLLVFSLVFLNWKASLDVILFWVLEDYLVSVFAVL